MAAAEESAVVAERSRGGAVAAPGEGLRLRGAAPLQPSAFCLALGALSALACSSD